MLILAAAIQGPYCNPLCSICIAPPNLWASDGLEYNPRWITHHQIPRDTVAIPGLWADLEQVPQYWRALVSDQDTHQHSTEDSMVALYYYQMEFAIKGENSTE